MTDAEQRAYNAALDENDALRSANSVLTRKLDAANAAIRELRAEMDDASYGEARK